MEKIKKYPLYIDFIDHTFLQNVYDSIIGELDKNEDVVVQNNLHDPTRKLKLDNILLKTNEFVNGDYYVSNFHKITTDNNIYGLSVIEVSRDTRERNFSSDLFYSFLNLTKTPEICLNNGLEDYFLNSNLKKVANSKCEMMASGIYKDGTKISPSLLSQIENKSEKYEIVSDSVIRSIFKN